MTRTSRHAIHKVFRGILIRVPSPAGVGSRVEIPRSCTSSLYLNHNMNYETEFYHLIDATQGIFDCIFSLHLWIDLQTFHCQLGGRHNCKIVTNMLDQIAKIMKSIDFRMSTVQWSTMTWASYGLTLVVTFLLFLSSIGVDLCAQRHRETSIMSQILCRYVRSKKLGNNLLLLM